MGGVVLLLLCAVACLVVEVEVSCTGPTCPPVVGIVQRKAQAANPNCTSVVLSSRIILGPANCLYDVRQRKRLQHIRFVQGLTNISVTQAELADPNSGRKLSVGLLQSAAGSVTSGLEWSTSSIEDIDIRGSIPGLGQPERVCKSSSPVKDAYMVERSRYEPVAYTCSGLSGDQAHGMPLYRRASQGHPSVFALDAGTCDARWGTARLRGARCGTRVGKEAFLSVCRFAAKYKQNVKGCEDTLLQYGDNRTSTVVRTVDVYSKLKMIPVKSAGLLVLHCQSRCVVCQEFVRVFDKLALHKSLARTTRLVRLEDVPLKSPPYTTIPYIEYRARGSKEFKEYTGPLTREGLLDFTNTRQKRGGEPELLKRRCEFFGEEPELEKKVNTGVTREVLDYHWPHVNDRIKIHDIVASLTATHLLKLTDNEALVQIDVSDLAGPGRDETIQEIASNFMEITDSPNINFLLDQANGSSVVGFAWSPLDNTYLEPGLGTSGRRRREVLAWKDGCSSVFLNSKLIHLPCFGEQLCYRIKDKASNKYEAIFASCYDTGKRTPLFTVHKVLIQGKGGRSGAWKEESGLKVGAVASKQATDEDYQRKNQKKPMAQHYLARGHLVPNADFGGNPAKQALTFHLTNAAPQWQAFNNGNWKHLEEKVKQYATKQVGRTLYVVTGTAEYSPTKLMNKRVGIPGVFWKAICDPVAKASILYWSTNPFTVKSKSKTTGCGGKLQTDEKGVVECHPVTELETLLGQPNFAVFPDADCNNGKDDLHPLLNIEFN